MSKDKVAKLERADIKEKVQNAGRSPAATTRVRASTPI